eukprot:scpid105083/ scgid20634/ 
MSPRLLCNPGCCVTEAPVLAKPGVNVCVRSVCQPAPPSYCVCCMCVVDQPVVWLLCVDQPGLELLCIDQPALELCVSQPRLELLCVSQPRLELLCVSQPRLE